MLKRDEKQRRFELQKLNPFYQQYYNSEKQKTQLLMQQVEDLKESLRKSQAKEDQGNNQYRMVS